MLKTERTYNIGVEATMDVIGGKWKPIILCHLRHQKMRTSELQKAIPHISQKMLTQCLSELIQEGVIERKVFNQVPPKVEYSLTAYGLTLSNVLDQLCSWGEYHVKSLQEAGQPVVLLRTDLHCP